MKSMVAFEAIFALLAYGLFLFPNVDSVEEEMHKAGYSLKSVEGYSQGGWILLDYYDIIVHIFSDEARRFYDIERIWNDAADVTKDLLS